MAEDTSGLTSDPTRVLNDTAGDPDPTAPLPGADQPKIEPAAEPAEAAAAEPAEAAAAEPAGRRSLARRLIVLGVGLGVLVLVAVVTIGYGVFRVDRTAAARSQAATRLEDACTQLEQRLNRLVPPGAARSVIERSDAIKDENAAARLLLAELDRMPPRARGYRALRGDWQSLLVARERYAVDLDASRKTGRPAFFVMTRDKYGNDRVERIIHRSPHRCDGSVRRLAAPDL